MTSPPPPPRAKPGSCLLDTLPARDLALLAPELERVELRQGQVLAVAGEAVGHVIFPERPVMIGLYLDLGNGRTAKTAGAGCWSAVGLVEVVGDGLALARARVVMPGSGLRIPAPALRDALPRSAALRSLAARHSEALVAQAMQNAACNAVHTVERRVARWLIAAHELALDGGNGEGAPALPLTQDLLADTVGAQRTTVTAAAARLKEAGLVSYRRGRICVLDPPGLRRMACSCNDAVNGIRRRLLGRADGR